MYNRTYLSRNFVTLGPLTASSRRVPRSHSYSLHIFHLQRFNHYVDVRKKWTNVGFLHQFSDFQEAFNLPLTILFFLHLFFLWTSSMLIRSLSISFSRCLSLLLYFYLLLLKLLLGKIILLWINFSSGSGNRIPIKTTKVIS